MFRSTTIFALIMLCFFIVKGQGNSDKIFLMTGKTLEGKVSSQDSLYVYYTFTKKSGKEKEHKIDLERVFSIIDAQGNEQLVYAMDTLIGNYFSVEEMRSYIEGEIDASKYSKSNWTYLVGAPVTAAAGYFLSGTILVFAVPFTYTVVSAIPKVKVKGPKGAKPAKSGDPAYVLGYERAARSKRLFKSLGTGLVGTAVGFILGINGN